MNFQLTREQELVQQMVREFAVNEVKPIAAEIDETERFPMENVKKMAKLGMMGIPFAKEYGGAGGDVLIIHNCCRRIIKSLCYYRSYTFSSYIIMCISNR